MRRLDMRPHLDEHDVTTLRQLYSEAHNWARHYQETIVNTNVMMISAQLIFFGLLLDRDVNSAAVIGRALALAPIALGLIGILLTLTLFRLYRRVVGRMVRCENLLNCFDDKKLRDFDDMGSLLDPRLMRVEMPPTVKFFGAVYVVLIIAYVFLFARSA